MSETTDPRCLSEAALAAIGEWEKNKGAAFYHKHVPALLAHAAYLAERLAEAEREIDRLVNKLQCPANARDDE